MSCYDVPKRCRPRPVATAAILSRTFSIGMGDKLDETKGHDFKAGGYAVAPAHMNHFAWAKAGAKSGVGTERSRRRADVQRCYSARGSPAATELFPRSCVRWVSFHLLDVRQLPCLP